MSPRRGNGNTTAWLLIALGVIFLIATLLGQDLGDIIGTFWPLILVLMGILRFKRFGPDTTGIILIVVGVAFAAVNVGIIPGGFLRRLWPLGLVAVGVWLLLQRRRLTRPPDSGSSHANTVRLSAVLGGSEQKVASEAFAGGEATALFGEAKIDLSASKLAPGDNYLHCHALFGGIEVIVPENWSVNVIGKALLGGVEDARKHPTPDSPSADARLIITANALFGSVEIKDRPPPTAD